MTVGRGQASAGLLAALTIVGLAAPACGGDSSPGSRSAFCSDYKVVANVDPTAADPAQLKKNIAKFQAATDRIAREAPDEIKDDAELLARRFPAFVSKVVAAGYDISKVDVDAFFGDAEVAKAGEAFDKYSDKHCG